jgi:serine/threonine protein kinase
VSDDHREEQIRLRREPKASIQVVRIVTAVWFEHIGDMAKSKLYGNRWKIGSASSLGEGGQSHIYRVTDTRSEFEGEYALKRVKNPERRERFRNEVEAIKRLTHPNIIRLIDHSALDDLTGSDDKQYLVTPIAAAGDLGRRERYTLYSGALDAVLLVAKQLASALAAAHAANVIHRDVKPQNVLFTGNGHGIWLADFGICLIRRADRSTPPDEVVGPRAYMAPELEDGGKLDVTPAADVYSLGKVIYFMLSGGKVLPRERLDDPRYASAFDGGQRHGLLQLLLRRMICALPSRIKNMDEVARELTKIAEWDQRARLLPISEAGLAGLDRLRSRAFEKKKITAENASAREQEDATRNSVMTTLGAWLKGELETLGAAYTCEEFPVRVRNTIIPANSPLMVQSDHASVFVSLLGVELVIEEASDPFERGHLLQLYLCEHRRVVVTTGPDPTPRPVRDLLLALLPMYRQTRGREHPKMSPMMSYLTSQKALGGLTGRLNLQQLHGPGRAIDFPHLTRVTQTFHRNLSQVIEFKASEWPSNSDVVRTNVSEAVDLFVAYIGEGASSVGP